MVGFPRVSPGECAFRPRSVPRSNVADRTKLRVRHRFREVRRIFLKVFLGLQEELKTEKHYFCLRYFFKLQKALPKLPVWKFLSHRRNVSPSRDELRSELRSEKHLIVFGIPSNRKRHSRRFLFRSSVDSQKVFFARKSSIPSMICVAIREVTAAAGSTAYNWCE